MIKKSHPIIVTSGRKYLDIDAYASMICYRELLRGLGYDVYAISTAPTNQSVPNSFLDYKYQFDNFDDVSGDIKYIVVDVSNPEFVDTFVKIDDILEIIDHHTGFEDYWQKKLGKNAEIEFIGSVCTIIFEKFIEMKGLEFLNAELCKLLMAGILDNTLNLKSSVTAERDIKAYDELAKIGKVPDEFRYKYFTECFEAIKGDLKQAILDDTKIEQVSPLLPEIFGQLIAPDLDAVDRSVIAGTYADYDDWIFNLIALDDGRSYLFYNNEDTGKNLKKVFADEVMIEDRLAILKKFKLRKEIMKQFREYQ